MMTHPLDQFRSALTGRGIIPPADIRADGQIHRCDAEGKGGKGDAAYLLHLDGIPAGGFENHRDGLGWENWRADTGRILTPAEEAEHRAKLEAARRQREAEEAKRHAEARERAGLILAEAFQAGEHPYLAKKGIHPYGAKLIQADQARVIAPNLSPELSGLLLVVPMRAEGVLHSLQFITANGIKRPLTGGRVAGCYFSIGNPKGAATLCICEGFATGATVHEATGYPVAVAFSAGNLEAIARALRAKFPGLPLILCADDDVNTPGNPGLTKARDAARVVGGVVAVPDFGADRPEKATDFNDMAALRGMETVMATIAAAVKDEHQQAESEGPAGDSDGWPDPQPLAAKVEPEPYPIDALPGTIRAAVQEVASFVMAPAPMVASSALAALSLACQAHMDAKRLEKLSGPVGLFILVIADSGERKSTCDGFFSKTILDYETAQAEAAKPAVKDHRAATEAWEAKRAGIKEKIRRLAKEQKSTAGMEGALRDLEHDKPEPPRIPRLLYADATPEALAYGLAKQWPSGGVVSAEAGIVFGSHGMGRDSVMRNLGLLNQLWDGKSLTIDRRTTESFTVKGARLTVALQVQEPTLREFFARSGALARGTGFLARFLVAWPESTQGTRLIDPDAPDGPTTWPHLTAFHRRIAEILEQPVPIDDDGALSPPILPMTPEAKAAWVAFHNAIEGELSSGGELHDVKDVASKIADNAARLAALFQMFQGAGGAIGLEAFEGASRITAWHLNESRRFFGELALPAELADAARLDSWLMEYCQRVRTHHVPTREAQRLGPIRDKERLTAAWRELEELDRVRVAQEGRRKTIKVNPALVGGAS